MRGAEHSEDPLQRVLAFQRRSSELAGGEAREIPEGWVVRCLTLPAVWRLNHVRVQAPVSYAEAVALAERHMGDAGFRQLYVEESAGGAELAGAFAAGGWEVDVELHSVLGAGPEPRVGGAVVVTAGEAETLALKARWMLEDATLRLTPEELAQLVECDRRTLRARRAVRLGVREPDGTLVGITVVFSDGDVAQVEDVYVAPEARGRGYGRALVTRAIEVACQAGHRLVFIVADDNGWPKRLYARLGFAPVGRTWLLHRSARRS